MAETFTHTSIEKTDRVLIASVHCEKIGAREAQIVEVDVKTAAPSREWRIVLNLTEVMLLASMGLGMLVTLHKECAAQGGKLAIFGLSTDILTLLKITHLERVLKIAPDRESALKLVS